MATVADQPSDTVRNPATPISYRHRGIRLVGSIVKIVVGVPRLLIIGLLMVYRALISPLYGQTCRFYPSCSQYALTAVQRHGAVRGSWLAARRLLRCHPWNPGGIDHVPPIRDKSGCEHRSTSEAGSSGAPTEPAGWSATVSPATDPESRADHPLGPPDLNCAPSTPRRAA